MILGIQNLSEGAAVSFIEPIMPNALSFATGPMIFVVAEEVIPGSQEEWNKVLLP